MVDRKSRLVGGIYWLLCGMLKDEKKTVDLRESQWQDKGEEQHVMAKRGCRAVTSGPGK